MGTHIDKNSFVRSITARKQFFRSYLRFVSEFALSGPWPRLSRLPNVYT
jgi:hypothetical protein